MRDWDLLIGSGENLSATLRSHSLGSPDSSGGSSTFDRAADDSAVLRLFDGSTTERPYNPVQDVNEPSDVIPGNTSTPYSITLGNSETGTVNAPGDRDYFAVQMVAGQSYIFTMVPSGTFQDTYLELRDASGTLIAIDDDGGPGDPQTDFSSALRFTATQSGTYYIVARAWEPDSGPLNDPTVLGNYTISFNTSAPQNPLNTIDLGYTAPLNIAVYFATTGQSFNGDTASRSWTQAEINSAMAALATWAAVAPFNFSITNSAANAQFVLTLDDDIGENVLGHMGTTNGVGYGAFDPTGVGWSTAGLAPGGMGFVTLVHEFGHGLGLAHPHDNGGVSEVMQGVIDPFGSYGTWGLNQGVFTTMSYNDGWALGPLGPNGSITTGSQSTPGPLDIALIQQRYGVNSTTNLGNTTYALTAISSSYRAIWDAGGSADIIQFSGTQNTTIDLRPATLQSEIGGGGYVSYVSGFHGGFTIAAGVVIENASGGSGSDRITGNSAANILNGNDNSDIIDGGGGNDTLIGGAGADTMTGGTGIDTSQYTISSTLATWTRTMTGSWIVNANVDGTDTVTGVEVLDFTNRDVVLDNAQTNFYGNGASDILWRNANDGQVAIWEMNGSTQTSALVVGSGAAPWTIINTGDFSGDGRDDILWRNTSDGQILAWRDGSWQSASFYGSVATSWVIAGVGDFNFDGRDDFLWRNTSDGLVGIWLLNGATSLSQGVIGAAPLDWSIVAVADFDGDGRDDILWRQDTGLLARWTTNGTAQTGASIIGNVPTEWSVVGTGDFDGDGRADILWRNNLDGAVAIWEMDGNTRLADGIPGGAPLNWHIADVGDYNGDGKDDILWRNDDGVIALWTMNGFNATATIVGGVPTEWGII